MSSGQCNIGLGGLLKECGEALRGGVEIQCRPGPAVEGVLDSFEVGFGVRVEIAALLEPEPQESVGVLVAAALPRRMRVAEVDRRGELEVDAPPLGHFAAAVPGDGAS